MSDISRLQTEQNDEKILKIRPRNKEILLILIEHLVVYPDGND